MSLSIVYNLRKEKFHNATSNLLLLQIQVLIYYYILHVVPHFRGNSLLRKFIVRANRRIFLWAFRWFYFQINKNIPTDEKFIWGHSNFSSNGKQDYESIINQLLIFLYWRILNLNWKWKINLAQHKTPSHDYCSYAFVRNVH